MPSDTLLMILNPRKLPECMLSLTRMPVPKVWLRNFREIHLEEVIPHVIAETDYQYYAVVSDDCVVSDDAYELALSLRSPERVATGYCNLNVGSDYGSVTKTPFERLAAPPVAAEYTWRHLDELRDWPEEAIPTYFAGMAFTVMHRNMWERFPWTCYGRHVGGWAADTHLCQRLQEENVPILAHRHAMIYHTKENWQVTDNENRRKLYTGVERAQVLYDTP